MKISVNDLTTKLVIFYLGLGNVFWFGPIEMPVFSKLKLLLFFAITSLVFYTSINSKKFKLNLLFILFGLGLLVTSISGLIQSSGEAIWRILNVFFLLIFVPSVFYLFFREKSYDQIKDILIKSTYIISFFCGLTILNYITGFPEWKFVKEGYKWGDYVSLYDNGFSTTRTSWSNGLSLYFLIVLFYFYKERKIKYALVGSIIILSQFLSGGRTGLVVSLLFLGHYLFFRINLKYGIIILSLLVVGVISQKEFLIKRLRIDRIIEAKKTDELRDFSSGRLYHIEFGIKRLKEDFNVIKGGGFHKVENKISGTNEIHNFWLKSFVEGGLFYVMTYVFFVFIIFFRMIMMLFKNSKHEIFLIIFIAGLITTLFEPNSIFGSVQATILWWAIVASQESLILKKK